MRGYSTPEKRLSIKLKPVVEAGQSMAGFNSNASDYEKLQWAICELEKRVPSEKCCDIRRPVNAGLQKKLVKLIGAKPLFKCQLDGVESRVLWDTGSQVSVIDMEWLSVFAPNVGLRPISDFLESNEKIFWLLTTLLFP
jgi:hypothetical protein